MVWHANPTLFAELTAQAMENPTESSQEIGLVCRLVLKQRDIPDGMSEWIYDAFYAPAFIAVASRTRSTLMESFAGAMRSLLKTTGMDADDDEITDMLSSVL